MVHEPQTIHVANDSELARLLEHVDATPLRLEKNGVVYRVIREDAALNTDVETFNATIDRLAGSWSAEDAESAIAYIYRAREEGSRPATRP